MPTFLAKYLQKTLTKQWHDNYHQPLAYVAGSRWLSGNLAFYSSDHPHVYINWNKRLSPWINEIELKHKGAIFIWEKNETIPPNLFKRFPHLSRPQVLSLMWLGNKNLPPIEIKVAYLQPAVRLAQQGQFLPSSSIDQKKNVMPLSIEKPLNR